MSTVDAIGFTSDGQSLLVSRMDQDGAVEFWDLSRRARTGVMDRSRAELLAAQLNGQLFSTSHNQPSDLPSGGRTDPRTPTRSMTRTAAVSPGGKYLATGDEAGRVTLRNGTADRNLGVVLPGAFRPNTARGFDPISALAFSHDGRTLAAAGTDGTLRMWDLASHQPLGPVLPAPGGAILSLAFGPDDRTLRVATEHVPAHEIVVAPEQVAMRHLRTSRGRTAESRLGHLPSRGALPQDLLTPVPGAPQRPSAARASGGFRTHEDQAWHNDG